MTVSRCLDASSSSWEAGKKFFFVHSFSAIKVLCRGISYSTDSNSRIWLDWGRHPIAVASNHSRHSSLNFFHFLLLMSLFPFALGFMDIVSEYDNIALGGPVMGFLALRCSIALCANLSQLIRFSISLTSISFILRLASCIFSAFSFMALSAHRAGTSSWQPCWGSEAMRSPHTPLKTRTLLCGLSRPFLRPPSVPGKRIGA